METFTEALGLVLPVLLFAGLLATVNERFVEHFVKPLLGKAGGDAYTGQVALVTGAAVSVLFGVDLFTPVAEALGIALTIPWAGLALTAVLVGGGSNFIHDVWPGDAFPTAVSIWHETDSAEIEATLEVSE